MMGPQQVLTRTCGGKVDMYSVLSIRTSRTLPLANRRGFITRVIETLSRACGRYCPKKRQFMPSTKRRRYAAFAESQFASLCWGQSVYIVRSSEIQHPNALDTRASINHRIKWICSGETRCGQGSIPMMKTETEAGLRRCTTTRENSSFLNLVGFKDYKITGTFARKLDTHRVQ